MKSPDSAGWIENNRRGIRKCSTPSESTEVDMPPLEITSHPGKRSNFVFVGLFARIPADHGPGLVPDLGLTLWRAGPLLDSLNFKICTTAQRKRIVCFGVGLTATKCAGDAEHQTR